MKRLANFIWNSMAVLCIIGIIIYMVYYTYYGGWLGFLQGILAMLLGWMIVRWFGPSIPWVQNYFIDKKEN